MASADSDYPYPFPVEETGEGTSLSERVPGTSPQPEEGARGSTGSQGESYPLLPTQQTTCTSKCTPILIICGLIAFSALVALVVLAAVGATLLQPTSENKETTEEFIAYEGDTPLLAEVSEAHHQVSVQQLCSGGGDHTIELYLAQNCDLVPQCFNVSSKTNVNTTKSPTITEVHFNGQSHIYMTSDSSVNFIVEISTPGANTSLVVFDNYTFFTDFEHSDHPSTDNALLVHMFKGQRSSYTFQGETNIYFAAFESLSNINFTFHYNGCICNYSHLNYKKSECDLPASTCQQKSCPFEYQSHNKTCILGYVPPSVTHPTFAFIRVLTTRTVTRIRERTAGITLLSLNIVPVVVLIVIVCVAIKFYCRIKLTTRQTRVN